MRGDRAPTFWARHPTVSTVLIANAAAVAVLALANVSGTIPVVRVGDRPPQEVTAGSVITLATAATLGAYGIARLLRVMTRRPREAFLVVATLVLGASFAVPAASTTGASQWWLDAMHLVVFIVVAWRLARDLAGGRR